MCNKLVQQYDNLQHLEIEYLIKTYFCWNQADVLVLSANTLPEDRPDTLNLGGCGEKGQFIKLTSSYILNDFVISTFGPKGNNFYGFKS